MDFEPIIWIYLPILIATIEVIWSLRLTMLKNSYFDSITSFLILVLNGFSVYILIEILNGGWPTYTPHLAILISTILIVIQIIRRKKTLGNIG